MLAVAVLPLLSQAPAAVAASNGGYWLVGSDGGIFAFGDARFLGAPSSVNREIVGMAAFRPAGTGPNGLRGTVAGDPTTPTTDPTTPTTNTTTPTTNTTTTVTTAPPPFTGNSPQFFSSSANPTWGTSPSEDPKEAGRDKAGKVLAIAEVGDKVFLAGEFAGVMPPGISTGKVRKDPSSVVRRPFLVALDVNTGALLDWDAHPDGPVLSLAVSPDGTKLYAGGRFRHIGGQLSLHLGAVSVDTGVLDATFQPPAPDSGVKALELSRGTLYVGGDFIAMGTAPYPQVAAVDATTGALRTGFVPPANTGGRFVGHQGTPTEDGNDGLVHDLAVTADGTTLFVGGDFFHFGGQGGLLALDAATGAPTAWQPVMTRPVYGLTIWPGDGKTVFAATGGAGGTVQSFLPGGKSTKPQWTGFVDGDATDVVATTERVYLAGHYDHQVPNKDDPCLKAVPAFCPSGTPHRKLAVFEARTGNVDPSFTGQANTPQGPYVAYIGAHHLYVGGDFTEMGPLTGSRLPPHPGFVQLNATG
jgi:hypothetical protein